VASKVSICSNALLLLGAQTINSLSESNDRALLAANLYDSTRDDVLRSHPWNCATKRVILAPETTAPAFGYSAAFVLPSDWLRTMEVGEFGYELDYKTENGRILADATALPLRYVFRNDQEATWDAMLVKAMELRMAAEMAYAITSSASMADLMFNKLQQHMKQARAVDGMDDPPQELGDYPLLQARFGGRRGF
jgi:hypothetical protein